MTLRKVGSWTLLPPAPDSCQVCATKHEPELPHNAQSLYYQTVFHAEHLRYPTWTDAMAHCSDAMKQAWRAELVKLLAKKGMPVPPDLLEEAR